MVDEIKVGSGKPRADSGALSRRDILTIARRFNAGGRIWIAQVPEGRLDIIKNQPEHHRKRTFQEEFLALRKKRSIGRPKR